MVDWLSFTFVQRGLIGAAIVGATCSLIGVFVVLRGMSYVGTGIAHGSLAGVALAFLLGWNPLALSLAAALLMVVFIEAVSRRADLKMDTAIGVIFSMAVALAVLFIGKLKRYTPDIMSYLFGNLLRVTESDLWIMGAIGTLVAAVILLLYKELQYTSFDPEMARLSGIPSGLLQTLLSVLMGLTIVISLQAVGELLVLALVVLPAAAASQITRSLRAMMILAVVLGVVASATGLITAFFLDAPTGSTIVMVLGLAFLVCWMLGGKRQAGRVAG